MPGSGDIGGSCKVHFKVNGRSHADEDEICGKQEFFILKVSTEGPVDGLPQVYKVKSGGKVLFNWDTK